MDYQLNIFLTAPDTNQPYAGYASSFPSANLSQKQYIHSWHKQPSQADYINVSYYWATHLSHELAHIPWKL